MVSTRESTAQPRAAGGSRRRRLVVVAGLLLLLAAVVAATSGDDATGDTFVGVGRVLEALLLTLGFLSFVMFLIIVALSARPVGPVDERPSNTKRLWALVALGVLVALLALWPRPDRTSAVEAPEQPAHETPTIDAPSAQAPRMTRGQALALGGLAIASIIALTWARTRSLTPFTVDDSQDRDEEPMPRAVRRAAKQLEIDEPRGAVIAAYAELEQALADLGLERSRTETPTEHIGRVGSTVTMDPSSLTGLAQLYERARFSTHPFGATEVTAANRFLDHLSTDLARSESPT